MRTSPPAARWPSRPRRAGAASRARRRADDAEDEHLGQPELALRRGDRHLRARGRKAHQRPLQGPEFLFGRAGRRARVDRGGAARHARPDDDLDRARCRISCPRSRSSTFRSCSGTTRTPVPCSTGRSGRKCCRSFRPKGMRGARVGRERLPPHDQQQAAGQHARRPQGPQDADDGKSGPHPGVQGVRDHPDADGVHRGVHRAAAGHRRRPGEPAVGDLRGQVRPGAEVHDADRPRLFAGADPDEQGAVGQALRRRQAGVHRRREGRRSRPTARASTTTSARRSPTCAPRA